MMDAAAERRGVRPPRAFGGGSVRRVWNLAAIVILGSACVSWPGRAPNGGLRLVTREPRVEYPALLLNAHVEGEVAARVFVDSLGLVGPRAFVVVHATHTLFAIALRTGMSGWQFQAARRNGRPANDSLVVHASFQIADGPHCPHPPRCSTEEVKVPAPLVLVSRDSLPRTLGVRVVSCPHPTRVACVPATSAGAV